MSRFFRLVVCLLVVGLSLGLGTWAVGAEETIPDDLPDDLPDGALDDNDNESAVIEFSESVEITEYELADGTVEFTLKTEDRVQVTVSDALAGVDQEGATIVPQKEFDVLPGEQTISMDVTEVNGGKTAGVSIDGETVRLSTSMDEQAGENPLRYFGGESGVFAGIGLSMFMSAFGAGFVLWREDKGVVKA